ncbi:MAG: formate/nitrite transporter family protein [Phycisphaerales bacterium]
MPEDESKSVPPSGRDDPAPDEEARPEESPLDEEDHADEVQRRSSVPLQVIHDAVRVDGEIEISRPGNALFWSGLAGGLAMGLSLIVSGALKSHLPDAEPFGAIVKIGYTVGFLVVILGRQQLYTENTLTVVLPLMHHRSLKTLVHVLRVWGIVLFSNLLGAAAISWYCAQSGAFDESMREAFTKLGAAVVEPSAQVIFLRGILAGWMIALIVWLVPAVDGAAKLLIIFALAYSVGLAELSHVIAGSVEALYLVWIDELAWGSYFGSFLLPVLLGNTLGGVVLTAVINHAQTVASQDD